MSIISKKINMTNSNTLINLKIFKELELIGSVPKGRTKKLFLTEKGQEILKNLDKINNLWK